MPLVILWLKSLSISIGQQGDESIRHDQRVKDAFFQLFSVLSERANSDVVKGWYFSCYKDFLIDKFKDFGKVTIFKK